MERQHTAWPEELSALCQQATQQLAASMLPVTACLCTEQTLHCKDLNTANPHRPLCKYKLPGHYSLRTHDPCHDGTPFCRQHASTPACCSAGMVM